MTGPNYRQGAVLLSILRSLTPEPEPEPVYNHASLETARVKNRGIYKQAPKVSSDKRTRTKASRMGFSPGVMTYAENVTSSW